MCVKFVPCQDVFSGSFKLLPQSQGIEKNLKRGAMRRQVFEYIEMDQTPNKCY